MKGHSFAVGCNHRWWMSIYRNVYRYITQCSRTLVLLVCFTVAGNRQFKMEWDVSRLKESLFLWIHNLNDDMFYIRNNIPRNSAQTKLVFGSRSKQFQFWCCHGKVKKDSDSPACAMSIDIYILFVMFWTFVLIGCCMCGTVQCVRPWFLVFFRFFFPFSGFSLSKSQTTTAELAAPYIPNSTQHLLVLIGVDAVVYCIS